jgi:hypothetical protein
MGRHYDLCFRAIQQTNEPPLKIGMEVNVRFIQDNGVGASKIEEM